MRTTIKLLSFYRIGHRTELKLILSKCGAFKLTCAAISSKPLYEGGDDEDAMQEWDNAVRSLQRDGWKEWSKFLRDEYHAMRKGGRL